MDEILILDKNSNEVSESEIKNLFNIYLHTLDLENYREYSDLYLCELKWMLHFLNDTPDHRNYFGLQPVSTSPITEYSNKQIAFIYRMKDIQQKGNPLMRILADFWDTLNGYTISLR